MICSILMPTRGRPDRLEKAIDSLYNSVSDLDQIEIILKLDNDDLQSFTGLKNLKHSKIIVGPRKNGYDSLGDFYQEMADLAVGKWVWIFNDDVTIEFSKTEKSWEQQLLEFSSDGIIIHPECFTIYNQVNMHYVGGPFPFVPTNCWKKFNHPIPNSEPIDHWLHYMLLDAGWETKFIKGMIIHHNRDEIGVLSDYRKL
jgi:hypothetical protein